MPSSESNTPLRQLIARWRDDKGGTYQSWFLWDERLKNFRSIRRGITKVVEEIDRGVFGNVYKGSSLETVVGSVAEQRQIFKGADHAFLWKPKLRIPDIYESSVNQRAFGRFLNTCFCCDGEGAITDAIRLLDEHQIKVTSNPPMLKGVVEYDRPGPFAFWLAHQFLSCSHTIGAQQMRDTGNQLIEQQLLVIHQGHKYRQR